MYLIHFTVLNFYPRVDVGSIFNFNNIIGLFFLKYFFVLIGSVIGAKLLYILVERPMIGIGKRIITKREASEKKMELSKSNSF